ncbi:MAG: PGPGW domain-containing protein [Actinomycetota bacterium]
MLTLAELREPSAVMKIADLIVEQRDKHVFGYARPHLDHDEEVIHWVRTRHPKERRSGFAYLTTRRLLVVWPSHADGPGAMAWTEIHSWGIDPEAAGGPILGMESPAEEVFVHIPVGSHGTARRVTSFLRKFARLAPKSRGRLRHRHHVAFSSDDSVVVRLEKRSAAALTKRMIVTVIGLLLLLAGVLITPIPGPWSLPLILAALAVLASEYDWAKDVYDWTRDKSRKARDKLKARRIAK